jgi:hypothetical protein
VYGIPVGSDRWWNWLRASKAHTYYVHIQRAAIAQA